MSHVVRRKFSGWRDINFRSAFAEPSVTPWDLCFFHFFLIYNLLCFKQTYQANTITNLIYRTPANLIYQSPAYLPAYPSDSASSDPTFHIHTATQ